MYQGANFKNPVQGYLRQGFNRGKPDVTWKAGQATLDNDWSDWPPAVVLATTMRVLRKLTGRSMRQATVERNTSETRVSATVNLDGQGIYDIETGIGFLDHM